MKYLIICLLSIFLVCPAYGQTPPVGTSDGGLGLTTPGASGSTPVSDGSIWTNGTPAIKTTYTTITSAEILGMFATPKQIAPAPGAGKMIIPRSLILVSGTGTNYAGGGNITLNYAGPINTPFNATLNSSMLTSTRRYAIRYFVLLSAPTAVSNAENKAMVLTNLTGAFTTGTFDMVAAFRYWEVAVP